MKFLPETLDFLPVSRNTRIADFATPFLVSAQGPWTDALSLAT